MNAVGQANIIGTRRDKPPVHAMVAKVAFARDALALVKVDGPVGTLIYTLLAARAPLFVQDYDPIRSLGDCPLGTDLCAGRLVAVSAKIHSIQEKGLPVNHSRAIFRHGDQFDAGRKMKLLFACDLTGLAAPACFLVDTKRITGHERPSPFSSG
jgi:hypothetical protein